MGHNRSLGARRRSGPPAVCPGPPAVVDDEPRVEFAEDARGSEALTERLTSTVHFEDAVDGWILAQIVEVPGAISQGRTRAEARENVIDALRTVLTPDQQLSDGQCDPDDESLSLAIDGPD